MTPAAGAGVTVGAQGAARVVRASGVLFDLDGTLIDTLPSLWRCGNAVLGNLRLAPFSLDDYRRAVGYGTTRMFETLLRTRGETPTPELLRECTSLMVRSYAEYWPPHARPFAGMRQLVTLLEESGVPIGVLTNREQAAVDAMLSHFFPAQRWRVVLGAGAYPNKPDPTSCFHAARCMGVCPQDIALVGDTEVDVQAARNAGMIALAVSWGFRDRGELEAVNADAIADDPSRLAALLGISLAPRTRSGGFNGPDRNDRGTPTA